MVRAIRAALILLMAACATGPKPAPQNPSPMADSTRVHERVQERPLAGKHFTIEGVLPKPVEVEVTPACTTSCDLVVHFLGPSWLPMQTAEDLGKPLVVAAVNLGAGSKRYSEPFLDPAVFGRLVDAIEAQSPKIRAVYLSGFSAGYGAIREILTERPDDIAGVLVIDGMHTGYIPDGKVLAEGGKIEEPKLMPFLRYAERAVRGEKRMVITHSEIFPGTFASSTETSDWLLQQLGMKRTPVVQWGPHGMQQLSEARKGSLVVLGFAGNSAPDHIDQLHGITAWWPMLLP